MFEVTLSDNRGTLDEIYADDRENAVYGAQIIFDEAVEHGNRGKALVTRFTQDGKLVACFSGKRPS